MSVNDQRREKASVLFKAEGNITFYFIIIITILIIGYYNFKKMIINSKEQFQITLVHLYLVMKIIH